MLEIRLALSQTMVDRVRVIGDRALFDCVHLVSEYLFL